MVNTRSKGSRIELKAKKELEAEGYRVLKKVHTRFDSGDFWGLFDLIALDDKCCRLLQITCNAKKSHEFEEQIRVFVVPPNFSKEIWVWKDRQHWNKYIYI